MRKRQADAECGAGDPGDYHIGLQVFGLFLILALSVLAASFPSIVRRFPRLPVPKRLLFYCRHFGTGVLIATAFCHLLPTAFESLLDPCLPTFWTDGYPAMSGLIAMVAAYVIVGIEMLFVSRGFRHSHDCDLTDGADRELESRDSGVGSDKGPPAFNVDRGDPITPVHPQPPTQPSRPTPGPQQPRARHSQASSIAPSDLEAQRAHPPPKTAADLASDQRATLQVLMLEGGILFHSIFIGMTIAFSSGTAFVILLIAISFHQMFEGLALGARIAAIPSFEPRGPKPWAMAVSYGVTAPVGQAIGLGVHGLFSLESETGLLMQGIFNAVSSGLLVYAGLVQLLAEDFLSEQSYSVLRGKRRWEACAAVLLGSALMATVGAWA